MIYFGPQRVSPNLRYAPFFRRKIVDKLTTSTGDSHLPSRKTAPSSSSSNLCKIQQESTPLLLETPVFSRRAHP